MLLHMRSEFAHCPRAGRNNRFDTAFLCVAASYAARHDVISLRISSAMESKGKTVQS